MLWFKVCIFLFVDNLYMLISLHESQGLFLNFPSKAAIGSALKYLGINLLLNLQLLLSFKHLTALQNRDWILRDIPFGRAIWSNCLICNMIVPPYIEAVGPLCSSEAQSLPFLSPSGFCPFCWFSRKGQFHVEIFSFWSNVSCLFLILSFHTVDKLCIWLPLTSCALCTYTTGKKI